MKKLFPFYILFVFMMIGCGESIKPIKSLNEAPAFIEKHFGIPNRVDTDYYCNPSLGFRYENRSDLSYDKMAAILSAGFNAGVLIKENSAETKRGEIHIFDQSESKPTLLLKIDFGEYHLPDGTTISGIILDDVQNKLGLPGKNK